MGNGETGKKHKKKKKQTSNGSTDKKSRYLFLLGDPTSSGHSPAAVRARTHFVASLVSRCLRLHFADDRSPRRDNSTPCSSRPAFHLLGACVGTVLKLHCYRSSSMFLGSEPVDLTLFSVYGTLDGMQQSCPILSLLRLSARDAHCPGRGAAPRFIGVSRHEYFADHITTPTRHTIGSSSRSRPYLRPEVAFVFLEF